MRKFFSEHPLFTILFTSCSMLIFMVLAFSITVVWGITKTVSALNIQMDNTQNEASSKYDYVAGNKDSTNKVLYIPITGEILTAEDKNDPLSFLFYGFTFGYSIKEELMKASKDPEIKGVILAIDSPGGTVTGSKAIYDGVEYYKNKTGNPVVSHVSGLGVSGSYMAALPADQVLADEGSLIGSIGVIMGPFKFYDKVMSEGQGDYYITTQNGITSFNIYAGKNKDLGDPYKPMSEETRESLQKSINNEYDNFVRLVADKRKLPERMIKDDIQALVYDVRTAQELKLIDGIMSREESYVKTAEIKGLPADDFQVVSHGEGDFWSRLFATTFSKDTYIKESVCPLCGQTLYLYGTPALYNRSK